MIIETIFLEAISTFNDWVIAPAVGVSLHSLIQAKGSSEIISTFWDVSTSFFDKFSKTLSIDSKLVFSAPEIAFCKDSLPEPPPTVKSTCAVSSCDTSLNILSFM